MFVKNLINKLLKIKLIKIYEISNIVTYLKIKILLKNLII